MHAKATTQPRKVDFTNHFADAKVKKLKQKQFTHDTIARHTGLTVSQVNYRVKKGNLSIPMDYRRGTSPAARGLIKDLDEQLRAMKDWLA